MNDVNERSPYFIDPEQAPRFAQTEGLETTVLTGLQGEQMMMVLNATMPGHSVPTHSHPHEQIGMGYSGRAILRIGDEEREVGPGDLYRRVIAGRESKSVNLFPTRIERSLCYERESDPRRCGWPLDPCRRCLLREGWRAEARQRRFR